MLELIALTPAYKAFRALGWPKLLPISLTVSVTYSCPSRCLTCDIWQKKVEDLTVGEYEKIFASLDAKPIWVTVSGGDQFLREDLDEVMGSVRRLLRPKVINLPMNGLITKRIEELLPRICEKTRGSDLILNLSVDDIGERHDKIRGAPGNYKKVMNVYAFIRDLQKTYKHVTVGMHTVISKYNVDRVPEIYATLKAMKPDSYITEIAENRVELESMEKDISPEPIDYARAVDFLAGEMRKKRSKNPIARLVESLRLEYYDLVKQIITTKQQVIPCYAGWASAQISPDGHVWGCCVRAESVGCLRDAGYDFKRIWFSEKAEQFRTSVRNKECACPLANASYTNILMDPMSLVRVARNLVS